MFDGKLQCASQARAHRPSFVPSRYRWPDALAHIGSVASSLSGEITPGLVRCRRVTRQRSLACPVLLRSSGQRSMSARSRVQRFNGQPDGLDLDHRRRSRSQPLHSLTSAAGLVATMLTAPRCTSTPMSLEGEGDSAGAGGWTATNALAAGLGAAPGTALGASIEAVLRGLISASRTQRCNSPVKRSSTALS